MTTERTDLDFYVHSIDLSHSLQTIISDDDLSMCLIDDITRYMRFQFGSKIFHKILFKGIQSLRYDNQNNKTSILNNIEAISNYSSDIITKQRNKTKEKEEERLDCNEIKKSIPSLNIYSIPDELLYHISSYLSLAESVQLNNLNYLFFKIFHKIPKFDTNQLNQSNMSWFNSYAQHIISKCKSITNINLYHADDIHGDESLSSLLSSFESLESLTISCGDFGNVDIMKPFLSAIPIQRDLKQLAFHGRIHYSDSEFSSRRKDVFDECMRKYGTLVTSLCIKNYHLKLAYILKSIVLNCRHLRELKLQKDAFLFYEESIPLSLCDKFIKYTNNKIDYVELCVDDRCHLSIEKFIVGLIHNVKSCHLTFLQHSIDREFVYNYIASYCRMSNDHLMQFRHGTFEDNMRDNGDCIEQIKSRISFVDLHQLSKLESFCLNISVMSRHILLWICLIVFNANNLKKISFMNDDYWPGPCRELYTKSFVKYCLENVEWMKFGILNMDILEIFIQVFNLYYKYHPMFKKQTKANNNKIKCIELIFNAGSFDKTPFDLFYIKFDWKKQIIGLMKLMCLYQFNWKISIQFQGEMDDVFRNKIWDEIRYGNWPNYRILNDSVWENIYFVDENGKKTGKCQLTCGIWRDYDTKKYEECQH